MNPKKKCIMVSTNILSITTVFNIDNNQKCFFQAGNQHIRMISCDTVDWSNDADVMLKNIILKYIKYNYNLKSYFKL